MKIGVLFTAYNCQETLNQSLMSWISARTIEFYGHTYLISAVSVPFKEYKNIQNEPIDPDLTTVSLKSFLNNGSIDYLIDSPLYISEAEARNLALAPLLEQKCDIIWLVDGDEITTLENIKHILDVVEVEKFISWFSLSFKNYVFDKKKYLKEPFAPPRIFRAQTNGYFLKEFYFDNDIRYTGVRNTGYSFDDKIIDYKELPSKCIPPQVAHITHITWLSNKKNKAKVEYQRKHFGDCSYKWNDQSNQLEFNEDYYKKHGLSMPVVLEDRR